MEVLLFCGLQAAGKSTYYREHFASTHLLISKDLMGKLGRKEQRQRELLHLALAAGHCVVIDNTNATPAERVPLLEIAHSYGASVGGYYFRTTTGEALARNAQREADARVPPVALYSTAARLLAPTYAEGFDSLYYVHIAAHSTRELPTWKIEEILR
jgi:predicted kinase